MDETLDSTHTKIVDALERCAADAADHGVAVAADQGIGHRAGTGGAVEFELGLDRIGHGCAISV
jgi:hypothetical protein